MLAPFGMTSSGLRDGSLMSWGARARARLLTPTNGSHLVREPDTPEKNRRHMPFIVDDFQAPLRKYAPTNTAPAPTVNGEHRGTLA